MKYRKTIFWLISIQSATSRLKYWPLSLVRGLCIILTWEDSNLTCFEVFCLFLIGAFTSNTALRNCFFFCFGKLFLKIPLRQELLFWDSAEDGVKIWAWPSARLFSRPSSANQPSDVESADLTSQQLMLWNCGTDWN